MRAFDYKNSVWKSSWYQKHGLAVKSGSAGAGALKAAPELSPAAPAPRAWLWRAKEKAGPGGHQG